MGGINKRKGLVTGTEASDEFFTVYADVSSIFPKFRSILYVSKHSKVFLSNLF